MKQIIYAIAGMLALIILGVAWKGFVLMVLWGWFVVPVFGVSSLALAPAIGLALLVSYLTYQGDAAQTRNGDFEELMAVAVVQELLVPTLALCVGFVVHRFM